VDDRMTVFGGPACARSQVCEALRVTPAAYECQRFPEAAVRMKRRTRSHAIGWTRIARTDAAAAAGLESQATLERLTAIKNGI